MPQQAFKHLGVIFIRAAAYWLDNDLWALRTLLVDDLPFHRRVTIDRQARPVRRITYAFRLLRPLIAGRKLQIVEPLLAFRCFSVNGDLKTLACEFHEVSLVSSLRVY